MTDQQNEIRFYFGFRSPYSRLGLHVIARAGLQVTLIPFTGPPEGTPFADPTQNMAKLAYYQYDVPRMTRRMGLAMAMPNPFDVDMSAANKAFVAADRDGVGLAFALAVSDARWGEGKDISDMDVLKTCARQVDWSAADIEAAQSDASIDEALAAHRALIEQDQVFGVPFAVQGHAKYWGHDRMDLLVEKAG